MRTAMVTGANTGMGKATSLALAKVGYRVVMLCRDEAKGRRAAGEVIGESGNPNVTVLQCDLADMASIRRAAADFMGSFDSLHVLVANAGVVTLDRRETADGFELQFGVNHLGHFLLVNLLLPLIKASAPARLVVVSSGIHRIGRIRFDDVNLRHGYTAWRAYAQSKLANILFTFELARRLEGTGVTANCLHPGAVATEMGVDRGTGFGQGITRLLSPFFQTPEEGAATAVHLALSPEVEGVTGRYFHRKRPVASARACSDKGLAARLWDLSEDLTGLR